MSAPYYSDGPVTLYVGDCIEVMRELADASVDAVVTDPPYALEFMGKGWDKFTPAAFQLWCSEWGSECLRLLKPGGHLLAFGGSRTWHRLAAGIEDAGFEIRDSIAWLYGSGFPKSLDVSKAIDKAAGATREVSGRTKTPFKVDAAASRGTSLQGSVNGDFSKQVDEDGYRYTETTAPATEAARAWDGWGTALKPSVEPVVVARKPIGMSAVLARIGSNLETLEDWCKSRASGAAKSSAPTPLGSRAAKADSAPATAAIQPADASARLTGTGEAADSFAQTGTSASEWTVETFWSTVTSWKACWDELCEATSTSTTSTTTSRTTDLTTLSSSLLSLTQSVTAQSIPEPRSWSSLASAVDNLFAAGVLSSRSTRALSAHESATGNTATDSQDAEGSSRSHFEPIVVARKPLAGTVAANVLAHGTGALNIAATRVGDEPRVNEPMGAPEKSYGGYGATATATATATAGRWPTNVVLDDSQAAELDRQSGTLKSGTMRAGTERQARTGGTIYGSDARTFTPADTYGDEGGASRFFPTFRYEAKAPTSERPQQGGVSHPTVKPIDLMRWLCRLVTRPGGTILEPFAGSGTTLEAALMEGFSVIGIEREADYLPLIMSRLQKPIEQTLFPEDGAA